MPGKAQARDPKGTSTGGRFAGGPPRDSNAATQVLRDEPIEVAEAHMLEWTRATGKEHGALYGYKATLIQAQAGGKNAVKIAPEAWAIRGDGVFTHTHPNGAGFSEGDLETMNEGGLKEFRALAVHADGSYTVHSLKFAPGAKMTFGKASKARLGELQKEAMAKYDAEHPHQNGPIAEMRARAERRQQFAYEAHDAAILKLSHEKKWTENGVTYTATHHAAPPKN